MFTHNNSEIEKLEKIRGIQFRNIVGIINELKKDFFDDEKTGKNIENLLGSRKKGSHMKKAYWRDYTDFKKELKLCKDLIKVIELFEKDTNKLNKLLKGLIKKSKRTGRGYYGNK